MTVIEFFDKDAIENVISTLLCGPDRVIFIGYNRKMMDKAARCYASVAARYGRTVDFQCRSVERNDLAKIVAELTKVVEQYHECTIDLTGGEDLYLVAAGIVHRENPQQVKLHRFNVNNSSIYSCDIDGNVVQKRTLQLSVEDNIAVYGGRVIYCDEKKDATYLWDLSPEFLQDLEQMWNICRENTRQWNKLLTLIGKTMLPEESDPLAVAVDAQRCYKAMEKGEDGAVPQLFLSLADCGLISLPQVENNVLSFVCKDEQVKRCLTTAGQVLELWTTACLPGRQGPQDDVLTGVSIDWDGEVEDGAEVENEIDVIWMNGLLPVFISCKNGSVDANELYKLNTVASRFGGNYAKKALVASNILSEDVVNRAKEMKIRIIQNVRQKDAGVFQKELENLTVG